MPETRADMRAQELLERGASLYEEGRLYEALSCWKQVLQLDPDNEIAAEYLRFVEDNFQIGVDAFLEHHRRADEPAAPAAPPPSGPLPSVEGGEPPGPLDDDIEELDWSELLEEGADVAVQPPPLPDDVPPAGEGAGEDFFAELEGGELQVEPGEEAAAWGADGPSSGLADAQPPPADEGPLVDPLSLPIEHFAAPFRPPASADHGSVSKEIPVGHRQRRRTSGMEVLNRPRRGSTPVPEAEDRPRDLAEMSDESIEALLDEDFRAWESGGVGASDTEVTPPRGGLGELPRAEPEPAAPPPPDDIEAIVRAGLADLEAIETNGNRRPAPRPSPSARPSRPPVQPPPPGADLAELMVQARRRQQAGDFSGSLELVEQVLLVEPDHPEARRYMEENTDRLLAMYRSRLGSLSHRPRVKMRPQEIVWQSLDHRAGYIMSQCDGLTTYQEIIDISGLGELETTRILARLVEQKVIG